MIEVEPSSLQWSQGHHHRNQKYWQLILTSLDSKSMVRKIAEVAVKSVDDAIQDVRATDQKSLLNQRHDYNLAIRGSANQ